MHLSEEIDHSSRAEFVTLMHKHLLAAGTAITQGSAFGAAEFEEIAGVGAKLIWSSQSNLVTSQTNAVGTLLGVVVAVQIGL